MKKVFVKSVKVFLVLMLTGFLTSGLAFGQEDDEIIDGSAAKSEAASKSIKVKPPINTGQNSQVGSSGNASAFKPALSPSKASDTISPASTAGQISPPQSRATSPSSVRQQRGRTGQMPPDAAGR